MQSRQTRRRLLLTLSSTTAAGLLGVAKISAQEALPETTTIRLAKIPGVCIAPQYVPEELLRAEGFSNVQYGAHAFLGPAGRERWPAKRPTEKSPAGRGA